METGVGTCREALQRAVASADIFALFSTAFSWPDDGLAQAVLDGSFDGDLQACLDELGCPLGTATGVQDVLEPGMAPEALLAALRREYSRLFLMPGTSALIFPYEAAFRHVAAGRPGIPALFIAPATKDVERRMRAFGALPATARREPVDSVSCELDFVHLLYTNLANALNQGNEGSAANLAHEIGEFRSKHVDAWIPDLMRSVIAETKSLFYKRLAEIALLALTLTSKGDE